jgi:hypothetical protein
MPTGASAEFRNRLTIVAATIARTVGAFPAICHQFRVIELWIVAH